MNSSNGMIDAGGTNPAYSGALALGYNAYAMYGGVSIGSGARVQSGASGSQTLSLGVAIGANSWARGGGVAIGSSSYTDGVNAIAFGRQATAVSSGAQAFGSASSAQGEKSTAIGQSATAKGARSIAFGGSTHTQDPYMYTDVYNTSTDGDDSIAMGTNTKTKGKDTIAIGKSNKIGNASTITNSLAIGNSNTINSKDVMVMGSNVNVGTGFDGAVVLGNASGVSVAVDTPSATIGGITYGNFAGSNPEDGHVVSVGVKSATSTINRQIQNVAAGQISSTSTDAINGSQLYSVANILGNQVSSTYFT
ncbi:MAG: hypothetical protein GX282_03560 [Campylobacteraceae bacterium]|nr:hypothetical protein [Campylobacteraceae bacterium]